MVERVARWTQKVTGLVLGGAGMGLLVGNVLICLSLILFGFDVNLAHLPPQA